MTQQKRTRRSRKSTKIETKPSITLVYSDDLYCDILKLKYELGMHVTLDELAMVINKQLLPYGSTLILSPYTSAPVKTVKQPWYKRLANWFKNLFK